MKFISQGVGVKEQYVLYDGVAMISAIGGTMGLCIGFSFNDTINFLLSIMEVGTNWLRQGNPRNIKKTVGGETPNEISKETVSKCRCHGIVGPEMRISAIEKLMNITRK